MTKKKAIKLVSAFLGISMFMFGILKFVNPFKGWYSVQVTTSGLPFTSYWLGIIAEITFGLMLIISLVFYKKIGEIKFRRIVYLSGVAIILMMLAACYVHLHPNVPSEVLPLKIKPPYIPGLFLLMAILNMYLAGAYRMQKGHR